MRMRSRPNGPFNDRRLRITSLALAGVVALGGASLRPAAAACDLSFVISQPTYRLEEPLDGATGASIGGRRLSIVTDAADLSGIEEITLSPLSGKAIVIRRPRFATRAALAGTPAAIGGRTASAGTVDIPRLSASTTYSIVIRAKSIAAPRSCPAALTERIGRFTTEPATALDALGDLTLAGKPPAGNPAGADAQAIYLKALGVLRTLTYPRYISFVVTTGSIIGGKPFVESFRSLVKADTDVVVTHAIPFASTNVPESPYGFNIPILTALLRRGPRRSFDEPFGTPEISPLYSFGLRRLTIPDAENPEPLPSPNSDVPSLGRVMSVAHYYDVSLVGIEPYGPRYAYHLRLAPVSDPGVYRVRDLWVDTQAFVIWKLRSAGIFDGGEASAASWDATYSVVDGHWLLATESSAERFSGGNFWHGNDTTYDGVTYTLSDFAYPDRLPDFSFFTGSGKTSATQF